MREGRNECADGLPLLQNALGPAISEADPIVARQGSPVDRFSSK